MRQYRSNNQKTNNTQAVRNTEGCPRWEGQGDEPSLPPGVVGARPARGPPPLHVTRICKHAWPWIWEHKLNTVVVREAIIEEAVVDNVSLVAVLTL